MMCRNELPHECGINAKTLCTEMLYAAVKKGFSNLWQI